MAILSYIVIGLIGGFAGGALGIGGGTIMVPMLVMMVGLTQHQAQGTVIGLLTLPVFLAAAWRYHAAGNIRLDITGFMIVGFIVGSFLGAHFVQHIPASTLRRIFGVALIVVGLKTVFMK